MPLVPYPLARAFLFGLDAERAHDLTLATLSRMHGLGLGCVYGTARVDDPVQVAGLRFPNRIGLAAGLDKNGRHIDALGALGFGFIEVGTVTPQPQSGNPKPRIFRLEPARALINRLGFNNDGLAAFLANVDRARFRRSGGILGLNIGKNAITPIEQAAEDYLAGLAGVYPHADYVTVNISSPNTQNLRSLQADDALDALLAQLMQARANLAAVHGRQVPLFVKIAPDLDAAQVAAVAQALQRHGVHGVIATNTTVRRDAVAQLPHGNEAGGLSGAPLRDASDAVIRQLRAQLGAGYPIIGVGGVMSAADALAKRDAGADLVQIYTGLIYEGPALVHSAGQAMKRQAAQAA